jgi:hypothetical protein
LIVLLYSREVKQHGQMWIITTQHERRETRAGVDKAIARRTRHGRSYIDRRVREDQETVILSV